MPRFLADIVKLTQLGPGKVFLDLGSGVANCLVQASLASGCTSYGIEMQASASEIGKLQVDEAKKRWRMYGLEGGECKSVRGDFIRDAIVGPLLHQADVVVSFYRRQSGINC